jgi:fatty acid desaturase
VEDVFETSGAIDKPALKALAERSDRRGLLRLFGHLAAILATGTLLAVSWGSPLLLPAMILHGVVLVFLFAPLHEAIHGTAFRSRALNRSVAFFCGLVLFLPSGYFRAFHFAHHRYTQDEGRDPELMRPKPETLGEYLLTLSGLVYWNEQLQLFGRLVAGRVEEPFVPERQRKAVVREARAWCWSTTGSCRCCSASRHSEPSSWPSTRVAPWCPTCCTTRAPRSPTPSCAGWPGT